ncbi:MAG: hypothetical protein OXG35_01330 [Acidobacteria bacterium]|nr:hypothetical protein [Acidobacteriota bacterium]
MTLSPRRGAGSARSRPRYARKRNALTLDGGSIRAVDDDSNARLSHDGLADYPQRKVDGSRSDDQAPAVLGMGVGPPVRGTFGGGDTVTVRLAFSEGVTVTGAPRFDYVVDESDRDDNGLSIDADAVDLNRGDDTRQRRQSAFVALGWVSAIVRSPRCQLRR